MKKNNKRYNKYLIEFFRFILKWVNPVLIILLFQALSTIPAIRFKNEIVELNIVILVLSLTVISIILSITIIKLYWKWLKVNNIIR